ncbi:MAG: glycine zipper domain-containing protein [Deltaproteobacteria bacterium]
MNRLFAVLASAALVVCGCAGTQQNHTVEGAAVGGLVGAGAGAIIGHQSGHAGGGALIGGALGALTGAFVGNKMPKEQQGQQQAAPAEQQAQAAPAVQQSSNTQLSVDEIVTMTGQGVGDDVIVDRIHLTNSRFSLTAAQVDMLKQKGVSQKVISAMQGA